jgi:hypothetical protein
MDIPTEKSPLAIETQFSIFLINKPGVLAQTLEALAREKINIIAVTMMDSVEHGVLRLVTSYPDRTREVCKKISAAVNETEVICVNLGNHPGALAEVTGLLAEAHININYAYCTAGARGGRTTGILKVADVNKAMKILERKFANPHKSHKEQNIRRH